jgi:multidrug efflux pump subunit AcrB
LRNAAPPNFQTFNLPAFDAVTLPRLAIQNAPFAGIVLLLLTLLGIVSFTTMPRSEDPQFDTSTVRVIAVYPGASPQDIEQLVVDPLEERINEIEDIDRIESTIQDGVAVVAVNFLASVDPDDGKEDVDQAVAGIREALPAGVRGVDVSLFTTTSVSVYQVALVSASAPYKQLQDMAEDVEQALERVGGVKTAETWAYPEQEVRVGLDLEQLRETGITLDQVMGAIQSEAQDLPGGDVDMGSRRFNIQTTGDYASIEDIERTIVGRATNGLVRLRDVATVALQPADETHRARFNGQRAVFVTVTQREGENIFNVLNGVKAALDDFRAQELPAGIAMHEVFDQAESVDQRVSGFFANLLQGILLVGGVILLALGFRASVIVMCAIPLSILMAIWALDLTGYGLQQISIVGLVIALGLLVDDAIVITENVARYRRKGLGAIDAVLKGTGEVGWAVISTSVTSILAFLPIVLVQSGSGDFIRSLPVTVIYALVASLIVSLTLTPLLASRWLGTSGGVRAWERIRVGLGFGEREKERGGERARGSEGDDASAHRPSPVDDPVSGPLNRLLQRQVDGPYRRSLTWALAHPMWVLLIAAVAFVSSLSLFPLVGVSFFPEAGKPQFLVNVTLPEGHSLDATDRAIQRVERLLDGRDDVRRYAANVGRDNPIVYYNVVPRREKATVGQVYVEAAEVASVARIVSDLETRLADVPGVTYGFEVFKNGPPVEAPVAIKVIGPDLQTLDRLAADVENLMRQTPGTENVENPLSEPKTDLFVNVHRDRAGLLGVRMVDVDRTVRAAMTGVPVAQYRDAEGEAYDIMVALQRAGDPRMADFDRISVASMTGHRIPLRQIADVELKSEPTRIDRFDTERAVTVTADVNATAGYSPVGVTQAIVAELDQLDLPRGYRTFIGGELEAQEDSFASLLPALIGAILGILAVLVLQFGSFGQPLIIFIAIPLSVIGAFPALLITGYTFSFTAFIGFTSLVGIVVNNSTILVDYANQLVGSGQSVRAAVQEASETRFAPIVLTTLTTVGGLLPLTLTNTDLWSPLGWVIIGGLLVSTFLTLLVVPVLYQLFTPDSVRTG